MRKDVLVDKNSKGIGSGLSSLTSCVSLTKSFSSLTPFFINTLETIKLLFFILCFIYLQSKFFGTRTISYLVLLVHLASSSNIPGVQFCMPEI